MLLFIVLPEIFSSNWISPVKGIRKGIIMRAFSLLVLFLFLSGCGSGSKESTGAEGNAMSAQPATGSATVQVSTQGPSAETVLYATQFTLRFPPGVSLAATAGEKLLPAGVLLPAIGGGYAGASYLDSAAGTGPAIQVNISHPSGFTVGPLATVNCTVLTGLEVGADDVTLKDFSARDSNGAPIRGITATATLQTR